MPLSRKPFEEQLHPRGFGGKFGHGTGTKKAAPKAAGGPIEQAAVAARAKVEAAQKAAAKLRSAAPKAVAKKAAPKLVAKYNAANVPSGGAIKGKLPDVPSKKKVEPPKPKKATPVLGKPNPDLPKPTSKEAGFNRVARVAGKLSGAIPLGKRNAMLKLGRKKDGSIDYDVRGAYADAKLTDWRKKDGDWRNTEIGKTIPEGRPFDSESLFRDPVTGEWDATRRAQQEQIIEDIWYAHAAQVPNQGRAVFSGGLGGSGKGYNLKLAGINTDADYEHPGAQNEFFTINPDVVKAVMAQRGMIPNADPKMTPMELNGLVHEECSQIAKELARRAYREKKNVVWDFTMASEKSVTDKLTAMRGAGYDNITALFVDTTIDNSIAQAKGRWKRGMGDFIGGKGDGGRFLPSGATRDNAPTIKVKPGEGIDGTDFQYRSKNRESFEATKDKFDGYLVKQNLGELDADGNKVPPIEVAQSGARLGARGGKQGPKKRLSDDLDVDAMTAELSDRFGKVDDATRETGSAWYPGSQEWIDYVTKGTNYTPEQGAAIVAAFSPNTAWNDNLYLAFNFIKGKPLRPNSDGEGTLPDNIKRARRVADGVDVKGNKVDDPIASLQGNDPEGVYKISNFYRNLTGNQEAVTVDRWAVRAAIAGVGSDEAEKILGRKGAYAKIALAYRQAAARHGVTPAAMQAIVWGQIRGTYE